MAATRVETAILLSATARRAMAYPFNQHVADAILSKSLSRRRTRFLIKVNADLSRRNIALKGGDNCFGGKYEYQFKDVGNRHLDLRVCSDAFLWLVRAGPGTHQALREPHLLLCPRPGWCGSSLVCREGLLRGWSLEWPRI